jgi:hypothetical protein
VKTKHRNRISIVGCCFGATYVVVVVVVYAATTHPSKVYPDWFPMFAMPWYALDRQLLLQGFVANTALLYLVGAILQRISRVVGKWETNLRNYISTTGCCLVATYIVIVVVLHAVIAATTNPSNMGMHWIPVGILAMPWPALDRRLLLPGFVANAALLYLLGAIFDKISRIVGEWG